MTVKKRISQSHRVTLPADIEPGEEELLEAFFGWVHAVYPNRGRAGCPGRRALIALETTRGPFEDEYTLLHIGKCAACLDDLIEIRRVLRRVN